MSPPFLLAILFLLLASVQSSHISGWKWSAVPQLLPSSTTRYAANCGPQAYIFYYQILVGFKPQETEQVTYLNFQWGQANGQPGARVWQRLTVPSATSPVEPSLVDLVVQQSIIAFWVTDSGTLSQAIQDSTYSPPQWDQYTTTPYNVPKTQPLSPWSDTLEAPIELYHLVPGTHTIANMTTDGYNLFGDFPSAIHNAWTSGATTNNDVAECMFLYYMGSNAAGTAPDGHLWYSVLSYNTNNYQQAPVNTGFPIDADSDISAIQWNNGTVYNMVWFKYQGEAVYIMWQATAADQGFMHPYLFHTGINITMGPSAVTYSDPYYDDYIVSLFFSNVNPSTGQYAIYNAIGMQDGF